MAGSKPSKEKKRTAQRTRGPLGVQLGEATARAMILQGGAQVFAERGVRLASVEDILEAAKISRRTFYRFYANKEDVLEALYTTGTEVLLIACRAAVSQESQLERQIERCIDAHLMNARGLGRLVFVLGGEAQRYESPLRTRRMQVHEELISLLCQAQPQLRVEPMVYRGLFLAIEGLSRSVLEAGDEGRNVSDASLHQAKRVMMRIALATLLASEPGLPALPTSD